MQNLSALSQSMTGDLLHDDLSRTIYATDASVYRELPLAVAYPKSEQDLILLIRYAQLHSISLIPRSGGTSLAGQCVGSGIVVDVSRFMNKVVDFDPEGKWVKVQPGIILDQLNDFLRPHGLMFGPNTSTANRCTIGGMVGNNSSGSTSIKYKTTRDHCLHIRALLSNEEIVDFYGLTSNQFAVKCTDNLLENKIYRQINTLLKPEAVQTEIRAQYPHPNIHRRNTGYALDKLLDMVPFNSDGSYFNLTKLLCGSEGTLCLFSEITLNLVELPPTESSLVLPHFKSINDALLAVPIIMRHQPYKCELMDKIILDCTKENTKYNRYRDFISEDPAAILMIEMRAHNDIDLSRQVDNLISELASTEFSYATPILRGQKSADAWALRKAGLGLLANIKGDAKAVACIEDTAVQIKDLPNYISDINNLMNTFRQQCVYYAHAGAGEIHLRPVLDLKLENDRLDFKKITEQTARIVKTYNGSLSGEHGDGRVRSEFIPIMLGDKIVDLLTSIKKTWDPNNIFNPGKIIDPVKMDENLRYEKNQINKVFDTAFEFDQTGGMLQLAEKCNGSGDCRKLPASGGTMCPSYMATRDEKDTTRARANALREYLTQDKDPFKSKGLTDILDLCLSCKGCATECPSNVDMAKLKAEFLHQKNKSGIKNKRDRLFATLDQKYNLAYLAGPISRAIANSSWIENKMKSDLNIHSKRSVPKFKKQTWQMWWARKGKKQNPKNYVSKVILFCDEYTNYFESEIGIAASRLLQKLNYHVILPKIKTSGRAAISKGYLEIAKKEASKLVLEFSKSTYQDIPIVGIEPSAILGFRDEYPALLRDNEKTKALELKDKTWLFEEYILQEFNKGNIQSSQFDTTPRKIKLHTHCHQKALSEESTVALALSIPTGNQIHPIPSGCCGMAGSFGYERKHYALSQKIAELVLFPSLRNEDTSEYVVATGTSCRHQIKDGLDIKSYHTAEILYEALV